MTSHQFARKDDETDENMCAYPVVCETDGVETATEKPCRVLVITYRSEKR